MPLIVIPNELYPPPPIAAEVRSAAALQYLQAPARATASPGGARTVHFVIPFAPDATGLGKLGHAAIKRLLPEARGAAWITIIGQALKGPHGDGFDKAWERALSVKAALRQGGVERLHMWDVIHEAGPTPNAEVLLTFPPAEARERSEK